jgi:undecaprenyl diphosphate synthase
MDGNGRWAQARGRDRIFGHIKGAQRARQVITYSAKLGLANLTLFAFSTENWSRPDSEVNFLMGLLRRYLSRERSLLVRNNIRFHCIGDITKLPEAVRREVDLSVQQTKNNTGMNLLVALNYGGRQDITASLRQLAWEVADGSLDPNSIDEKVLASRLQTADIDNPDLVIRTSGEQRLSNFLLWQCAYSELYFTPTLWPDFTEEDFHQALLEFSRRQRRFGGIECANSESEIFGDQTERNPAQLYSLDSAR